MKNILLVGAGNMGGAIATAMLEKKFILPENFYISDRSEENLKNFSIAKGNTSTNALDFIKKADVIIMAVKPQMMREILSSYAEKISADTILISIAAGVSVNDLQESSGLTRSIRVMPNTPLLVGKGTSGYFFSGIFSAEEKAYITAMMETFGLAIECETEEKINAITALSGSGPAYFFRILEIMAQQGEEFGFTEKQSQDIALQTLLGAGMLAEQSPENFSTLRQNVTSKGGTTAAALESFEKNNLPQVLQDGMKAAKNRAEEL